MSIGFAGLLALLFIGLKLGGLIAWPWIWVLSPLWIGFVLTCLVIIFGAVTAAVLNHKIRKDFPSHIPARSPNKPWTSGWMTSVG